MADNIYTKGQHDDWQRHLVLQHNWRVFVRPLCHNDELYLRNLLEHVTNEDLRLRFFASIKEFSHQFLCRLTHYDKAGAIAFIAFDEDTHEPLGVVRIHADRMLESGEYAVLLRSDLKGHGLGWALMQLMIEYARSVQLKRVTGQVLQQNSVMLTMCRELGFAVTTDKGYPGLRDVVLTLTPHVPL
jgi:RimJ/RimL family protein N-acetyltransferase